MHCLASALRMPTKKKEKYSYILMLRRTYEIMSASLMLQILCIYGNSSEMFVYLFIILVIVVVVVVVVAAAMVLE